MSDTPKHSVSVAGIVVRDDGRILAVQRRDNAHWEPPGGVLELGETFEDGVRREVAEETGVTVDVERLTGAYKNLTRGVVALVFRCHPVRRTPTATDEAQRVRWLTPDEIRALHDARLRRPRPRRPPRRRRLPRARRRPPRRRLTHGHGALTSPAAGAAQRFSRSPPDQTAFPAPSRTYGPRAKGARQPRAGPPLHQGHSRTSHSRPKRCGGQDERARGGSERGWTTSRASRGQNKNKNALAGRAGLRDGRRERARGAAGCGIPPTSRRATTRHPGGRAARGRPPVASRAAPGPPRGRAAPGRRDAARAPACKITAGRGGSL